MKKVKLGNLIVDFEEKTIFKGCENQKNKFIDRFEKGNQGWNVLEYFFSHPNEEISATYLIDNVMHSTFNKAEGVITATISTLVACGLEYKEIFERREVLGVNYYKFIGEFIDLGIVEDRRIYFQNLCIDLNFSDRDNGKGKARNLWDFYIRPRFQDYVSREELSSPFSQEERFSIFLIAPSGVGKTTLLEATAFLSIDQFVEKKIIQPDDNSRLEEIRKCLFEGNKKIFVPIYIKAVNVKKHASTHFNNDSNIKESILDFAEKWDENLAGICKSADEEGSLLFLIDAVDEIENEDNYNYFLELLRDLHSTYKKFSLVITSRFEDRNIIKKFDFSRIKLCNFSKRDVIDFIELQISKGIVTDNQVSPIIEKINNDEEFAEFMCNAYCATKFLVHAEELDSHFSGVVELIANSILKFRSDNESLYRDALERLAWSIIKNKNTYTIKNSNFSRILQSKEFPGRNQLCENDIRAQKMIEELSKISGILDQHFNEKNDQLYFFQSKLLLYYFAASYIIGYLEGIIDDVVSEEMSYSGLKSLIDIRKNEASMNVLLLALSLLNDGNHEQHEKILYNHLITTFIVFEECIDEKFFNGLEKLINKHYGNAFIHKPVTGRDESVYLKIMKNILEMK